MWSWPSTRERMVLVHLCFLYMKKPSHICLLVDVSWNGFFFFNLRKLHLLKSVFYGLRWASKIPAVSDSYKRCTPWLELETCYTDLKSFAITLYPLRTWNDYYVIYRKYYLFCVEKVVCAWKNYMHEIKVFMQLIT